MKHIIYIFLLFLACCTNKTNYESATASSLAEEKIWASQLPIEQKRFVFSDGNGRKSRIGYILTNKECQYFTITPNDIQSVDSILEHFLTQEESLASMQHYFRQYIGFTMEDKRFVYINLFAYYHFSDDWYPENYYNNYFNHVIYTEHDTGNNFGFAVIDMQAKSIVRWKFKT